MMAARDIEDAVTKMKTSSTKDPVSFGKLTLTLENAATLLGVKENKSYHKGDTCPEVYMGNQFYPYQYNNWEVEKCDYGKNVKELVTIILRCESREGIERVTRSLWNTYPGVKVMVENNLDIDMEGVKSIDKDKTMSDIASIVDTKYVLLGKDMDYVSNWSNIERSVRLLSEGGVPVVAVGGAVRNSSGHWHVGCHQVEMHYYRLEIRPGYEYQFRDCMVCDVVEGPVLMKTETMRTIDQNIPIELSLLDLALTRAGLMLACPDIMYFTRSSNAREIGEISKSSWLKLAGKHQFQGVVTDFRLPLEFTFTCSEVNLVCDIESQAAVFMLPWCCFESFRFILMKLEEVSSKLGIEYFIESGTCLGAVKLANFIPWDIDMDIVFITKYFHLFKPGGGAHTILRNAGISLYSYSEDMYHVKGAGSFKMHYNGITVEMLGSFQTISKDFLPAHLNHNPTRIKVGHHLWIPVVANPGLYIRGRYGPGYLFHVQSWRYKEGMSGSYDSYTPGAWAPCTQPGHQACLNNYPIQGNTHLLSDSYP